MKLRFASALFVLFAAASVCVNAQKTLPTPTWQRGESLFYRVHLKINRDIKTKSALSLPQSPTDADLDVQGILQVAPISSGAPANSGATRLRTWFLTLVSDLSILPRGAKPGEGKTQRVPADDKFVDCTLEPTGEIDEIAGLDALAPEQQQAWREWATRFAAPFILQKQHRNRGDKWTSDEPETIPSPIADLRWQEKSRYVRDEPCAALQFARSGNFQRAANSESCAVILTTSSLLQ